MTETATHSSNKDGDGRVSGSVWSVYLMLIGSVLLWGGTWPVGRLLAGSLAPCHAALLRFMLATVALVLICRWTRGRRALRVRVGLLPRLFLLGATGIFGYSLLFFYGLRTIDAGRAALIVGCIPVCIALGSALLARRRPAPLAILGILLSLFGVGVVMGRGNPLMLLAGRVQADDLMILGCVLCWTAYTLLGRSVMRELAPLVVVTWSCLLGTVMLLPFSLASGLVREVAGVTWADGAALAYLGIAATALAYYWYYQAVCRIGPVSTGVFINLVPLSGLGLSCLFLKEPLYRSSIIGGLLVITGVMITVWANRAGGGRRTAAGLIGTQTCPAAISGVRV